MQVLYGRHHVRVYRFGLRLVRDEQAAEDLVSEVFLDVWRQAGKFEGRSAVSTWLLAITGSRLFRRYAAGRISNLMRRLPVGSRVHPTIRKLRCRRRIPVTRCASASTHLRRTNARRKLAELLEAAGVERGWP